VWEALADCSDRQLADIAKAAVKESRVQLRHASDWVVRFGDGTDESHRRISEAFAGLWPYCDEVEKAELRGTDPDARNARWHATVRETMEVATVVPPVSNARPLALIESTALQSRAELLAEMQSLARQHPGATW
jgi:ring-1,2-phenylacetyl-CoA epoxidase subunit PaaC